MPVPPASLPRHGKFKAIAASVHSVLIIVSTVGCDDIPTSSLVPPALTSSAFPLYELGVTAAHMILQMVRELPLQEHVVFPFQIHVRASSVRAQARMADAMFRMGELV